MAARAGCLPSVVSVVVLVPGWVLADRVKVGRGLGLKRSVAALALFPYHRTHERH